MINIPNHVQNCIEVIGSEEKISELFEFIKPDKEQDSNKVAVIDFNKIIPMPPSLDIESGSMETDCLSAYLTAVNPITEDFGYPKLGAEELVEVAKKVNELYHFSKVNISSEKVKKEDIEVGKKYFDNIQNYGAATWYDWRINNWGTKWNAYEQEPIEDNKICFDTAWSNIDPIMIKLSEKFPELEFIYQWADEDLGANVGKEVFSDGEILEEDIPEQYSKEAYELAASIWGIDLADEGYVFDKELETYISNYCSDMKMDM